MTIPKTTEEKAAAITARVKAAQPGPLGKRQTEIISELETTHGDIAEINLKLKPEREALPVLEALRHADNAGDLADQLNDLTRDKKPMTPKFVAAAVEYVIRQNLHAVAYPRLKFRIIGYENELRPLHARVRELEAELKQVQDEILGDSPAPAKSARPVQSSADGVAFERFTERLGGSTRRLPV